MVLSLTHDGHALMAEAFQRFNSVEQWATSELDGEAKTEVPRALRTIIRRVESA